MPAPVAVQVRRRRLVIARIVAVLLVVVWAHWVGAFATAVCFILLAAAAVLLALAHFSQRPQLAALRADR